MSNMAASLYCLNRYEEAETHWVQAVHRQPAYLEAVEHLVHLLCASHRSREAVEIISFVQRTLRLPDNPSSSNTGIDAHTGPNHTPWDSAASRLMSKPDKDRTEDFTAPGFGLSGYSVAGSENGRMIALIHAKGNMLYALKDIDQASDAFEEAS